MLNNIEKDWGARSFKKSIRSYNNNNRHCRRIWRTLPEWVEIVSVKDKYRQQLLEMQVDKGESSAIALALETPNCIIILDDYKARKIANHLGLILTGTIGVIIRAKINGIIPSIKPIIQKIKQTDFRLSIEIEMLALKEAGE